MVGLKLSSAYPPNRSQYWDNIKGGLIILVVFGHFLFGLQNSEINNTIVDAIYLFHMPAFVFVSGYFSKSKHSRCFESLLQLLSAFILVHGIFLIFYVTPAQSARVLESYHSEWYLLALISWRLLTPYLVTFRGILPISICVSILIGFFPGVGGNETLAINKIATFFPFFIAGYLTNIDTVERIKSKPGNQKAIICIASLLLACLIGYIGIRFLSINDRDLLAYEYQADNLLEPLQRIVIFAVSALMILFLLHSSGDKTIPILTAAGKNSLAIYLLHRFVTLAFYEPVSKFSPVVQIFLAALCTFLIVLLFGSDKAAGVVDAILDRCVVLLTHEQRDLKNQNLFRTFFYTFLCACLVFPVVLGLLLNKENLWPVNAFRIKGTETAIPSTDMLSYGPISEIDPIYRVMDDTAKEQFDQAFSILFAGDLILLEDQVRNAYTGDGYDFSSSFEYTKKYIDNADFSIGVFEGPMGGTSRNYSSSNYEDGKELYLNFPDEWGMAVKDAGFDLVTTANNHALDMGEEGLRRTIDVFEDIGLDHTGTYKDSEEKEHNRIKMIEKDGFRMAILSYTMLVNNTSEDELVKGTFSYSTSMIVPANSKNLSTIKAQVQEDFAEAKAREPDLIIVLPHWGTQFEDYPDESQLFWEDFFKKNGADIILGDHTHSVQPITIDENCLTLFSPGNYANIYREHNGDCSALVEVYCDRNSKKVIGGAVIPMWTTSSYNGNYRPIPVFDILTDQGLGSQITTYDIERVAKVNKHITGVMLRHEMDLNMIQERYYFNKDGFMRSKVPAVNLDDAMKRSAAYRKITEAVNVCFVGDSVTEGTKNGGVPWYEPLEKLIKGKAINCGWGGATTKILLRDHLEEIVEAYADLYVFAIGANDVRYRSEECALTPEEYVDNLKELRQTIINSNPEAKFVFVSPWISTDGDQISALPYREKTAMTDEYTEALKLWTMETGDLFVDANAYLRQYLERYSQSDYLIDYIHPNATKGVELYSEAFLQAEDKEA